MPTERRCPRCGRTLHSPGVWTSEWSCVRHGVVQPLKPAHAPSQKWLEDVASRSQVPVWMPWPLPAGWLFTGVAEAGTQRDGPQATVVACSGPNPAPRPTTPGERPADLLLVAEAPGVGLGAHLAGLDDVDPGGSVGVGPADAKLRAGGFPEPLWLVQGAPDRATYVGQAGGVWLYLVFWPDTAGLLLAENLDLHDLRSSQSTIQPPVGAPCPRLP